ncbi:queuosine salvage family protein [Noviherbaspirillum aerium]|uniref:queuosine salvage family protein n=1 Tax=Noviherbaspirillum aerium TaxID=2588497 RepID=UPI00124BFD26|nr:queuosine salvage family protein [Noviherbaspirillum aerium]
MTDQHSAKERLIAQARLDYRPELVAIDPQAIERLPVRADRFSQMSMGLSGRAAGRTAAGAAAYSIAFNSLNFMFWTPTPQGMSRYHWRGQSGTNGLKAAFEHAWGEETTAAGLRRRLCSGDPEAVIELFGDISLPKRRAHFLREVLSEDRLEQAAADLVSASGRLGVDHAQQLARRFPVAFGQDAYLTRAQLAIMWFAGYLAEQDRAIECDVCVAANYQMPRIMRSIKALRFSAELAAKVDAHTLLLRDSTEERAIRAATVLGVQMMARHLGVSESAMVNVLWENRDACGAMPHHLTITTDY